MKSLYKIAYLTPFLVLLSFALSCRDRKGNSQRLPFSPPTGNDSIVNSKHLEVISTKWVDSLIENYIKVSKTDLVRTAVNNKLSEEWLFDQIMNTDTSVYFIYQIGHDVSDDGGVNPRFITDQWVYVDTAKKVLYEYDVVKDSLIRWPR